MIFAFFVGVIVAGEATVVAVGVIIIKPPVCCFVLVVTASMEPIVDNVSLLFFCDCFCCRAHPVLILVIRSRMVLTLPYFACTHTEREGGKEREEREREEKRREEKKKERREEKVRCESRSRAWYHHAQQGIIMHSRRTAEDARA
jgi:hypothetical protein